MVLEGFRGQRFLELSKQSLVLHFQNSSIDTMSKLGDIVPKSNHAIGMPILCQKTLNPIP